MAFQNPAFETKTSAQAFFANKGFPRTALTLAAAAFVFWTFAYVCRTHIFEPDPSATLMTMRVILELGFAISAIVAVRWIIAGFRSS